jgi:membrane protein
MRILELRDLRLLFEVSKRSLRCFAHHDMPTYAAALAYRALFAIFPFFGFLILLLGFFRISVLFEWLIDQGASRWMSNTQSWGSGWSARFRIRLKVHCSRP